MRPELSELRARLRIDKHRLDEELETHSQIQEQIAATVAKLGTEANKAKDELARVEARLAAEAKEEDPKLTVAGVDAEVKKSRERITAWHTYQNAREEHEEWAGLLSAWVSRGYGIKTLADLHGQQYYAITTVRGGERPLRVDYDRTASRETAPRRRPRT